MDWNKKIELLEKTYSEALSKYEELANVLLNVDVDTLTGAQIQVEQMAGYIASLRTQSLQLKAILQKVDEFIRVANDTLNKTQRAISQAIKEASI